MFRCQVKNIIVDKNFVSVGSFLELSPLGSFYPTIAPLHNNESIFKVLYCYKLCQTLRDVSNPPRNGTGMVLQSTYDKTEYYVDIPQEQYLLDFMGV